MLKAFFHPSDKKVSNSLHKMASNIPKQHCLGIKYAERFRKVRSFFRPRAYCGLLRDRIPTFLPHLYHLT